MLSAKQALASSRIGRPITEQKLKDACNSESVRMTLAGIEKCIIRAIKNKKVETHIGAGYSNDIEKSLRKLKYNVSSAHCDHDDGETCSTITTIKWGRGFSRNRL